MLEGTDVVGKLICGVDALRACEGVGEGEWIWGRDFR